MYYLVILLFSIVVVNLINLNAESKSLETEEKIRKTYEEIKITAKEDNKNYIAEYRKTFNNKDIVASIEIKGADISEIVVQSKDNEYYLKNSISKEKNRFGAIFMDYRNDINDKKILIYGHNSKTKNPPFHNLEKYVDKNFYKDNQYIIFETENGKFTYQIFSIMINEISNYTHTSLGFSKKDWISHINWMNKNSIYDTQVYAKESDEILTLQTCYYKPKKSFLIINAKKLKKEI